MRKVFYIVQKEFIQIFRNKIMLPILFIMPFIQLIVFAYVADYEIKHIDLHIIDQDLSEMSRGLINKFQFSKRFNVISSSFDSREGFNHLNSGEADLFIHIPNGFEKDFWREKKNTIQITADAVDGLKAGVATGYVAAIINNFNVELINKIKKPLNKIKVPQIDISYRHWYNPLLNYKTLMVPGVLVMLVTMIAGFLSGMNIVREKEMGTIEQLNVTPIKKIYFILGKLIPFWILGIIILSIGLIVARFIFNIPMEGSMGLIYLFTGFYLLFVLGLGLLISSVSDTQQQALFITWFLLIIFILMSGLFTPIESMPTWAQSITKLNPIAWFVEFNRRVMLKGSQLIDVLPLFINLFIGIVLINSLAIWSYRKRV